MQKTKLSKKFYLSLVIFSLVGQVAWVVENMYLNVFIYKMFHASADQISLMVAASAVTATVTTLLIGALSDKFGSEIGSKYAITLSNGKTFLAILADQKADADTIADNTRDRNGAVIEFIVDAEMLPQTVKQSGSIGTLEQFSGEVIEIRGLK